MPSSGEVGFRCWKPPGATMVCCCFLTLGMAPSWTKQSIGTWTATLAVPPGGLWGLADKGSAWGPTAFAGALRGPWPWPMRQSWDLGGGCFCQMSWFIYIYMCFFFQMFFWYIQIYNLNLFFPDDSKTPKPATLLDLDSILLGVLGGKTRKMRFLRLRMFSSASHLSGGKRLFSR